LESNWRYNVWASGADGSYQLFGPHIAWKLIAELNPWIHTASGTMKLLGITDNPADPFYYLGFRLDGGYANFWIPWGSRVGLSFPYGLGVVPDHPAVEYPST